MEKIFEKLEELNIKYQIINHKPALTIEMANQFIEGIEGVRTKTLFLTNRKKKNFYLLILSDDKRLDMNSLKEILLENQIKIASFETLFNKMKVLPGCVSPFSLINNTDKDVKVYFDEEIVNEEIMSFHPNTNEKTLFIKTKDIFKFLKDIGFEINIIKL